MAVDAAALLTAVAFGLDAHCFVAPCDVGLGLFAREALRCGQTIVEYGGPRLPISQMVHGAYALEVPGSGTFIDGNLENSPAARWNASTERTHAIYANHSRMPNCRLEHWPRRAAGRDAPAGQDTLWLVASEPVAAGAELRFDYEEGGSNYWQGFPPPEREWRSKTVAPPPPSGVEPSIDYLPALLAGRNPPWPDKQPR